MHGASVESLSWKLFSESQAKGGVPSEEPRREGLGRKMLRHLPHTSQLVSQDLYLPGPLEVENGASLALSVPLGNDHSLTCLLLVKTGMEGH